MDTISITKDFTEMLLDKLDIDADVSVDTQEAAPREEGQEPLETLLVTIDGDDLGALIGHHGETLNSLGHILSLVTSQKSGTPTRVIVDAGNWREHRKDQLSHMADRALDQVLRTGREYHFPPMNASDRRIIHMILSEEEGVTTQSMGEGKDRHIVLEPVD